MAINVMFDVILGRLREKDGGGGTIGGGGTLNRIMKFTPDGTTAGDSSLLDDGATIKINDGVEITSSDGQIVQDFGSGGYYLVSTDGGGVTASFLFLDDLFATIGNGGIDALVGVSDGASTLTNYILLRTASADFVHTSFKFGASTAGIYGGTSLVGIKGSGATSATSAFDVINSASASILTTYDNGAVQMGAAGYAGSSGRLFIKTLDADAFAWGQEIYNGRTSGLPIGLSITLDGVHAGESRGLSIAVTGAATNTAIQASGNIYQPANTGTTGFGAAPLTYAQLYSVALTVLGGTSYAIDSYNGNTVGSPVGINTWVNGAHGGQSVGVNVNVENAADNIAIKTLNGDVHFNAISGSVSTGSVPSTTEKFLVFTSGASTYTTAGYFENAGTSGSRFGVKAIADGANAAGLNVAGYFNAQGAATNYAIEIVAGDIYMSGTGSVGINGVPSTTERFIVTAGTGFTSAIWGQQSGITGTLRAITGIADGANVGGAAVNIGGYFSATNATNNYGIIVPSGGGSVGIGTSTPTSLVHIHGTGATSATSSLLVENSSSNPILYARNDINVGINTTTFGTGAVGVLSIGSGTAPSTSPADLAQIWVVDIEAVAGKAGHHLRSEDGSIHAFGDYHYFGDPSTNGSWRIGVSGTTFIFQRREAGSWVTKDTILS